MNHEISSSSLIAPPGSRFVGRRSMVRCWIHEARGCQAHLVVIRRMPNLLSRQRAVVVGMLTQTLCFTRTLTMKRGRCFQIRYWVDLHRSCAVRTLVRISILELPSFPNVKFFSIPFHSQFQVNFTKRSSQAYPQLTSLEDLLLLAFPRPARLRA